MKREPAVCLAVECPQCGAAPGSRCKNYKGKPCAPHADRSRRYREVIDSYGPQPPKPPPQPEQRELFAPQGLAGEGQSL